MTRRNRSERGYVLATAALVMVPLLLFVGFATDVGAWYAEGSRAQRAADAAALAGVIWLPDLAKATSVAVETAKANGYDDADPNITVTVTKETSTKLSVVINNSDAPRYFSKLAISSKTINRSAESEYVLPVPLGSPYNYFGTGRMVSGAGREGFFAAINGYCAPREQGDPYAPRFMGNWTATGQTDEVSCPGATNNPQYKSPYQYRYAVKVPANRPGPLKIHLYSPRPAIITGSSNSTNTKPDTWWGQNITTTFTIRQPDSTPLNDEDNAAYTGCSGTLENTTGTKVYAPGTAPATEPAAETLLSTAGWRRFCTIPTNAAAGTYFIDVGTLAGEAGSFAYNGYSIIASYNGEVCDSRTSATCPQVSGRESMSIMADAGATSADFNLAEIEPVHAGKTMIITMFDPGEGGDYIQVLDPNGDVVDFKWQTSDGTYPLSSTTDRLNVSGCSGSPKPGAGRSSNCKFNELFVELRIELPANYATLYPSSNWWKVHYQFTSSVTDRTTWSVTIGGNPVHLVTN